MHVHRVCVVEHVLPPTHHVLPLGQEASQQTHVVHGHQRAHHPVAGAEDAHEDRRRLWIPLHRIVDQGEILAHEPARGARERHVVILGDRERREQPYRPLP